MTVEESVLAFPTRVFPDYAAGLPDSVFTQYNSLNSPNNTCGSGDTRNMCITDMSSYIRRPDITEVVPDHQFYLGFANIVVPVSEVFAPNTYRPFSCKPQ